MLGIHKHRSVAWKISHYVAGGLDPMVVLPAMVIWLLWWYRGELTESWFLAIILFIFYVGLPGLGFFWLYKTRRINDLDVSDWKKRLNVFLLFLGSHTIGMVIAGWMNTGNLFWLLLSLWGLLLCFTLANHFTKISLHVGTLTTWITLLVWLVDKRWGWLYLLVGLMAWVRVYQKHHTWWQVSLGIMVPFVVLSLVLSLAMNR